MANSLKEYMGEEEYTKFTKYIKYCEKYLRDKGIPRNDKKRIYRECLMLLDCKQ